MCLYDNNRLQLAVAAPLDRSPVSFLPLFPARPCRHLGLQPPSESALPRLAQPGGPFSAVGTRTKLVQPEPSPNPSEGPGAPPQKPALARADYWPKTRTMTLVQPGWEKGSPRGNPGESGPGGRSAWPPVAPQSRYLLIWAAQHPFLFLFVTAP